MTDFEKSLTDSGHAARSCSVGNRTMPDEPPPMKKRNLPGMPDPNAEVIVLSPRTLMATNRFVCEICSKGFQRNQNLQLHRRGHNLPWVLRQRTSNEVQKKVYVCPEPTCVHHNPSRALGDLTGIKKHFFRKHGERKWQCDSCSKKYAVKSDWKAHMKTCGTREYRCECRASFSRRDSFLMHKAFCDALAEENAKAQTTVTVTGDESSVEFPSPPPLSPVANVFSPVPDELPLIETPGRSRSSTSNGSNSSSLFPSVFAPPTLNNNISILSDSFSPITPPLCANSTYLPPLTPSQPAMSATGMLQKAAEMGATSSNSSFLLGLGLAISSSTSSFPLDQDKIEPQYGMVGVGLGLGLNKQMMCPHPRKSLPPVTLDLLGLGGGCGGGGSGATAATGVLQNLLATIGGGSPATPAYPFVDKLNSKPIYPSFTYI